MTMHHADVRVEPAMKGWAPLAAVLLLALALRAWQLQGQALFCDEVVEASIAKCQLAEIVDYPDGFPPLYHLLLAGWLRVFDSPESGRWLSVVAGIAAVYAVYRWALESIGPRAALAAGCLLAISPLHVYFSQEMRAYSLYLGFAALTLRYFFLALQTNALQSWTAFIVFATLGNYTHYYAPLLAAMLGVVLLYYRREWSTMRRGIAAFGACGMLSLPVIFLLKADLAYQVDGFALKTSLLPTLGYTAFSALAGVSLGPSLSELHYLPVRDVAIAAAPWIAVLAPAGAWLAWAGWRSLRTRPFGPAIVVLALASAPLIGVAGQLAGVSGKMRYWSWVILPMTVWLAAGTAADQRRRMRSITSLALAILAVVQLTALIGRYENPKYANEDMRSVAERLVVDASSSTPIMVVSDYMAPTLRYYLEGEQSLEGWLPFCSQASADAPEISTGAGGASSAWLIHPQSEKEHRGSAPFDDPAIRQWLGEVEKLTSGDGQFWLVYSRPFHGDPGGRLLSYLQGAEMIELVERYPGVDLYRGVLLEQHLDAVPRVSVQP